MVRAARERRESSLLLRLEEFLLLTRMLGERPTAELVEPFTSLAHGQRRIRIAAAGRSLRRRGIVIGGQRPAVPVAVSRLIEIMCRPLLEATVHRCTGGAWQPPHRLAAVPEAGVQIVTRGDHLRLTPFAADDLFGRLVVLGEIERTPPPPGSPVALPLHALRAALSAPTGDPTAVEAALLEGEVAGRDVASLAAALSEGQRTAIGLTHRTRRDRWEGAQIAWAEGRDGYWHLPAVVSPLAGSTEDRSRLRATHDPQHLVSVEPVHGDDLVASLLAAVARPMSAFDPTSRATDVPVP